MNTGIKAPEGMGIVVETADIQNCNTKTGSRWDPDQSQGGVSCYHIQYISAIVHSRREIYLHDTEEEEDDKDADMWMEPRS